MGLQRTVQIIDCWDGLDDCRPGKRGPGNGGLVILWWLTQMLVLSTDDIWPGRLDLKQSWESGVQKVRCSKGRKVKQKFCLYFYVNHNMGCDLTNKTAFVCQTKLSGHEADFYHNNFYHIFFSPGLSIHTFHGNFFVRSTDLVSLPNVSPDSGFSMQIDIEDSLTDSNLAVFQSALLYTSTKGNVISTPLNSSQVTFKGQSCTIFVSLYKTKRIL